MRRRASERSRGGNRTFDDNRTDSCFFGAIASFFSYGCCSDDTRDGKHVHDLAPVTPPTSSAPVKGELPDAVHLDLAVESFTPNAELRPVSPDVFDDLEVFDFREDLLRDLSRSSEDLSAEMQASAMLQDDMNAREELEMQEALESLIEMEVDVPDDLPSKGTLPVAQVQQWFDTDFSTEIELDLSKLDNEENDAKRQRSPAHSPGRQDGTLLNDIPELGLAPSAVHAEAQSSEKRDLATFVAVGYEIDQTHQYKRAKAHKGKGVEAVYKCGYCGRLKTSSSSCSDGRVRIRCECGGQHQDQKPRMHATWSPICLVNPKPKSEIADPKETEEDMWFSVNDLGGCIRKTHPPIMTVNGAPPEITFVDETYRNGLQMSKKSLH